MTPEQAIREIERKITAIQRGIAADLPRIVGKRAADFYRDSFRKQGFTDTGLQPWKPAKRTVNARTTGGRYGTLLSARKELHNSIHFISGVGRVTIRSDKPYSQIHNEGGTVNVPVTPDMRKFAWAQHYKEVGKKSKDFTPWKGLALTPKKELRINIPKRQFMGKSEALNTIIATEVKNYVERIFK